METKGVLFILLLVGESTSLFVEDEAPRRFARSLGAGAELVTAQAAWSVNLNNFEDTWYFMEERITNFNDTLVGRADRTYLRNALDGFQAKLSANVQLLRHQANPLNSTEAEAAQDYANMLEGGLRCQSNGALDALDTYTCDVMTEATNSLDDVLASLLKGDQHMNLAVTDLELQECEWSLAMQEWNLTLRWVYEESTVNSAHEYVLETARRLALLHILHWNDTSAGCSVLSEAISKAQTDLSNLTQDEQNISSPIITTLQQDQSSHCK